VSPSSRNRLHSARPMPPLAPVTSTTRLMFALSAYRLKKPAGV
jgi:hypothetical protein